MAVQLFNSNALDSPVLLAKWTPVILFHPERHAAVVKGMVTIAPHDNTMWCIFLLALAVEAGIHDSNLTDCTIIALYIP